jgi:hypothetical protein
MVSKMFFFFNWLVFALSPQSFAQNLIPKALIGVSLGVTNDNNLTKSITSEINLFKLSKDINYYLKFSGTNISEKFSFDLNNSKFEQEYFTDQIYLGSLIQYRIPLKNSFIDFSVDGGYVRSVSIIPNSVKIYKNTNSALPISFKEDFVKFEYNSKQISNLFGYGANITFSNNKAKHFKSGYRFGYNANKELSNFNISYLIQFL